MIAKDTPEGLKRVVGGQTLTIRPTDPDRLEEAAAIIGHVARARPESLRTGVISVPVPGDEVLQEVIDRLAADGISLTELSLNLPSLDEAFLALTGTPAQPDREPLLVEAS